MPHIHRIRVNNVKYNFGTQFYDDFIMRFDGKNALYDLANGGGKSVLMLLLFQNLIPNCTLDDKQPIEKLFRTSDGSTSIHSLIEWKLDEADVEDGFKYMLTGFCARKAKDDGDENGRKVSASIDYFNYVIFYRAYNDNDLVNLPLSKGRERMTYTGLRSYLKDLEHKDYNLKVHIFDRKGAYQNFISRYGLYESQWEIVRGINKTEGHVRTYFESNYKTTRKVVEDLLIEEIIQKAYAGKTEGGDEDMAKTLMMIRDKLLELSGKRQEIAAYDRQAQALESFAGRVSSLTKLYEEEDNFRYNLVRAYNGLLEAVKLKARDGAVFAKEQGFTQKHLQEIERRIDTVKVQMRQEQLKNLEANASKIEIQLETLEAAYAKAALALSEAESMKDFLEYEGTRKDAQIIRGVIAKAGEDPKGHLAQMKKLAYFGCQKYDEKYAKCAENIRVISENIKKTTEILAQKQEDLRQAEMAYAVADNNITKVRQEEKLLVDEISALRHQVNALLIEGSEKEIREYKNKEKQFAQKITEFKHQHEQWTLDLQNLALALEQNRTKISAGDYRKKVMTDFFEAYSETQTKADRLLKVYGAAGYDVLKQNIYGRYKKAAQDLFLTGKQIEDLKSKKLQLAEKNPVPVSEGVLRVMEYIRRCHNASCIAGADYLKELSDNEKESILQVMPFLPYAVIVRTEFDKISDDYTFRTMDFGGIQVILVRYDTVVSGKMRLDESQMIFTSRDKALFYDKEIIAREIQRIDKQIDQCELSRKRLADQEKTYQEDLDYVYHFIDTYYARRLEFLAEKDTLEKEMAACNEEISLISKQIETCKVNDDAALKNIAALEIDLAEITASRQAVERIGALNQKLYGARNNLRQYQQQKNNADQQKVQLSREIADINNQNSASHKQLDVYERQLLDLKKMWQDVFAVYYDADMAFGDDVSAAEGPLENGEDTSGDAFSVLSLSEIEVRFKALKQAYEAENSDMEDKKKLLETYEKNMERLVYAMNARNASLEQMAQKKADGVFVVCDTDTIASLREQMDSLREDIRLQKTLVSDALANKHNLTGRVENAVNVIEEKYGYYKEVDLKNMDFDVFMQEYKESLETMKEKMSTLSQNIEKNQKEQRTLDDIKKDMERLMRSIAVTIAYTKDSDRSDTNFKQKFVELTDRYERLRKDEEIKKAEFEKDRDKLVETLRLLKSYDLADEIRYQVSLPATSGEAGDLGTNIADTVKLLMLEKERIEKGIEDMRKIKENFERQCIQRCTDIKMELDRLPKMSKITLNDEHIQMISLKIPYVKEDFYSQKMSEYIDRIVEKSDTMTDENERLKYLRNQLAWKHLFSVIVTDMDQIRLSLYKRERIREQSRFLKYEEAVGSTGQSQGIYIQFLIAVINYISAIHSKSNDTSGLKKVIFIDNPFGAAKDIYIWEPIFALLKENHVQLIVPARGATPAITGKFDVNYILGQKVIGTRQQTVVIDYHSNVDIETMEYRTIEFEQQVFDFI